MNAINTPSNAARTSYCGDGTSCGDAELHALHLAWQANSDAMDARNAARRAAQPAPAPRRDFTALPVHQHEPDCDCTRCRQEYCS